MVFGLVFGFYIFNDGGEKMMGMEMEMQIEVVHMG